LRKLMLLAAVLAVAMIAVAPALAQDDPQVVADAKAKTAVAGGDAGAKAEADCKDGIIESKAGGVVAKAPCEPPPPPPPPAPKAAPAPPPPPKAEAAPPPPPPPPAAPKELPKTGGTGMASLFALGAGALLVAGGLVARRIVK
jgi:LPXTG-motif cell wall-anchored protein